MEERIAALHNLVTAVAASLQMRGVYEEVGGFPGEVEGCKQTANSALDRIEEQVAYFRELCK